MLAAVDRRSSVGKRDYAILLLLVTYGLRGREVAALTLDDIDWERERLRIPERKAGHSTAYPLSSIVGEARAAKALGASRKATGKGSHPYRHALRECAGNCRPSHPAGNSRPATRRFYC